MSQTGVIAKKNLSVKVQVLATIGAIVAAVAVPQIFHLMGIISGTGTSLGEIVLPMHLPVILAGLLAGPWVGLVTGLFSPIASYFLTGMPGAMMLPFMVVELAGYGLAAGLLRKVNIPVVLKVLIAQVAGRLVRAAAILIGVKFLGSTVAIASIWTSIPKGIMGIVLQLVLIPLIVYRVENLTNEGK